LARLEQVQITPDWEQDTKLQEILIVKFGEQKPYSLYLATVYYLFILQEKLTAQYREERSCEVRELLRSTKGHLLALEQTAQAVLNLYEEGKLFLSDDENIDKNYQQQEIYTQYNITQNQIDQGEQLHPTPTITSFNTTPLTNTTANTTASNNATTTPFIQPTQPSNTVIPNNTQPTYNTQPSNTVMPNNTNTTASNNATTTTFIQPTQPSNTVIPNNTNTTASNNVTTTPFIQPTQPSNTVMPNNTTTTTFIQPTQPNNTVIPNNTQPIYNTQPISTPTNQQPATQTFQQFHNELTQAQGYLDTQAPTYFSQEQNIPVIPPPQPTYQLQQSGPNTPPPPPQQSVYQPPPPWPPANGWNPNFSNEQQPQQQANDRLATIAKIVGASVVGFIVYLVLRSNYQHEVWKEINNLKEKLKETSERHDTVQNAHEGFGTDLTNLKENLDTAGVTIKEHLNKITSLEKELSNKEFPKKINEKLDATLSREFEQNFSDLINNIEKLKGEYETLLVNQKKINKEISSFSDKNTQLQKNAQSVSTTLSKLKEKVGNLKKKLNKKDKT
jgi:hypothetical protein